MSKKWEENFGALKAGIIGNRESVIVETINEGNLLDYFLKECIEKHYQTNDTMSYTKFSFCNRKLTRRIKKMYQTFGKDVVDSAVFEHYIKQGLYVTLYKRYVKFCPAYIVEDEGEPKLREHITYIHDKMFGYAIPAEMLDTVVKELINYCFANNEPYWKEIRRCIKVKYKNRKEYGVYETEKEEGEH